jgi:protocatechuate 3,4-dioxygenase beta subunit
MLTTIALGALLAAAPGAASANEPVLGGRCEGCEAVFEGLTANLASEARIAPTEEPGEPMVIDGTVFDAAGKPAPGVIVYAYHTDARGIYPPGNGQTGAARRHGRLRGWARSDASGNYRFLTIRPASYPSRTVPAHVHMHVIEPGRGTYWIDDIHFADDPLLDEGRRGDRTARGGPGTVVATKDERGTWKIRRDIHLGHAIPGYPPVRDGR